MSPDFWSKDTPLFTFVPNKKQKPMEIVTIEAGTFLKMCRALEDLARKMHEKCGSAPHGMDEWIDNQEACILLGVSPRSILYLRRNGKISYSCIDRKVYYKRQDIIRFLEDSIQQKIHKPDFHATGYTD